MASVLGGSSAANATGDRVEKAAPTSPWRVIFLASAGATAVALAYAFAPEPDSDLVVAARPVRSANKVSVAATPPPATPAGAAARNGITLSAAADPFVPSSFVPPPPPPPVAVAPPPPPAPKAPPLPFTFVGLLESGAGKPAAFLSFGDALLIVSAGETIEHDYRVESLSPAEIVLTYLPLNEKQRLVASGAKP